MLAGSRSLMSLAKHDNRRDMVVADNNSIDDF
jgi:hypothetical protein